MKKLPSTLPNMILSLGIICLIIAGILEMCIRDRIIPIWEPRYDTASRERYLQLIDKIRPGGILFRKGEPLSLIHICYVVSLSTVSNDTVIIP